jgi:hypothetical protein
MEPIVGTKRGGDRGDDVRREQHRDEMRRSRARHPRPSKLARVRLVYAPNGEVLGYVSITLTGAAHGYHATQEEALREVGRMQMGER